jgi:hypothetical protein
VATARIEVDGSIRATQTSPRRTARLDLPARACKVHRGAAFSLVVLALYTVVVTAQAAEPAKDHATQAPRTSTGAARGAATSPVTSTVAPTAEPSVSAMGAAATPAPPVVHGFDAQRWAALLREPGPAMVVFTSTDCAHCPQAIERLTRHQRDERRAGRPVPRLDVVVLDGRDEPEALTSEPHYRQADRLFAVDGQTARLRHAVNPAWFGQTPYVALMGSASADGRTTPRFVSGTPSERELSELR